MRPGSVLIAILEAFQAIAGETPVVRTTGARFSQNLLSAISGQGRLRFMVREGRLTADQVCQCLHRLLHGARKPMFFSVNGHPRHNARKVPNCVQELKGKLRLLFLSPNSPELNPGEWVRRDFEDNGIGRRSISTKNNLSQPIIDRMTPL